MTRALVKELVKRNEFPVAPALVDRYAQLIVNRAKQQLMMMGIDVEGVDDAKMREEMRGEAEEEARGSILVQAIAEREGITVSDADLQKRIAELAAPATRTRSSCARSWRRTSASTRSRTRSANRRRLIC